jgi:hypothetical protein
MESVMRLSVRLSVCLVDSAVARPRRRLLAENLFGEERNAMRCDAMQFNAQQQQQNGRKRKPNERASREERERERERSQRLDSGLNVVSVIRLAGNPKLPFCGSSIDPLGRTGFFSSIIDKVASDG